VSLRRSRRFKQLEVSDIASFFYLFSWVYQLYFLWKGTETLTLTLDKSRRNDSDESEFDRGQAIHPHHLPRE